MFTQMPTDIRDLSVDIKVLDSISGSVTNGMWVNAVGVSTYGINPTTEELVVINEYGSALTFYIKVSV